MNSSGNLTSEILKQARQRMILAARNGDRFVLASGIRYGKSQLHKEFAKKGKDENNNR